MEFQLNRSERLVAKAVSTDKTRPVLGCVHIRKGIIEAADGLIAVQKEISYQGDEKMLIRGTELRKCVGSVLNISVEKEGIKVQGTHILYLSPETGNFPNIDGVYPDKAEGDKVMERLTGDKLSPFQIALSRDQLLKLLSCLDEDVVRFSFYGRERPVKVETLTVRCLIMPMSVKWGENDA